VTKLEFSNKIEEQIKNLQLLKEDVKSYEEQREKCLIQDATFYEVNINENDVKPLFSIFEPVTVFNKNTDKCGKCENGLVRCDNDFSNEYDMCNCYFDTLTYVTTEIKIYETIEKDKVTYYISYKDSNVRIINSDMVYNLFDIPNMDKDHVYYTTKDECDKYCEYKNIEVSARNGK
jgi:hypothetical protein